METMTVPPAAPRKWYEIWRDVWLHPNAQTFMDILKEPDISSSRGFKWVALTGLISGLVSLISIMLSLNTLQNGLSSLENTPIVFSVMGIYGLCVVVLTPIFAVLGLVISAGIYHGIAKLFHGTGEWGQLVFCFAAILAPLFVVSSLISVLVSLQVPFLSFCFGLASLALSVYAIVLFINAIKAVEDIGTGAAIGTYFAPVVIVLILSVCLVAIVLLISSSTYH